MASSTYRLWTLQAGIHAFSDGKTTSTSTKTITPELKKRWMDIISARAQWPLMQLVQSFNITHTKLEEKTPLALFVSQPQIFYELFWPYARERLGREYYILQFDTPFMVKLNFVYELSVSPKDRLEQPMIYLGCLSDRVPILTTAVNNTRESIIPYENLIPAVKLVLEKSADWVLIRNQLKLEEIELEDLVRDVLTNSKPQFIEFSSEKYTTEKLVIVSMKATGSLLEHKNPELRNQQRNIWIKIKSAFLSLYHGIVRVLHMFLSLPIKEQIVRLQIYPKSSFSSLWIYIYAPKKYQLWKCSALPRCNHNILENNSPNNPALLSYRLGRKKPTQTLYPIDVHFSVKIPIMDSIWLNAIDKLLLLFSIIWLLACLKFLPLHELSTITEFTFSLVTYPGIIGSTFVLIGFVLLARSWLFHESTVHKAASIRFAALLIFIIILCLIFVGLCIVYNCVPKATS